MRIRFSIENEEKFKKELVMDWIGHSLKVEDIEDDEACDFYVYCDYAKELFDIVADVGDEIELDIICDECFIKLR